MKIYYVHPLESSDDGDGVVEFPDQLLRSVPSNGTAVSAWSEARARLSRGEFLDYMTGTAIIKVCSARLRRLLQSHCSDPAYLQWLPVSVEKLDGTVEQCFGLQFAAPIDVLDPERTVYVARSKFPRRPAFKSEIVARYPFFGVDGLPGLHWFVTEPLRREIADAKFTGIEFELAAEV